MQAKGSEIISWAFGTIMFLWFAAIAFSGIASIFYTPTVLKAVRPYYAIRFLLEMELQDFLYYLKSFSVLQAVMHYMPKWVIWVESLF